MVHALVRNWWAVAAVGVLAIILGVYAIQAPALTLASLVFAFGAYALASGVVQIVGGFTGEARTVLGASRTWLILSGVLSVLAGIATFAYPGITAVALYTLIGVWAVMSGIAHVVMAIVRREELTNTWLVALGGVASAILGVYLLARPAAGIVALGTAIGVFAIAYGAAMVAAGFMLKRVHDTEVTIGRRVEAGVETPSDRFTRR